MHKFVSFAALCALLLVLPAESTICWIEPSDDFHERMPLILQANSNEFIYPNKCGSKSLRMTFQDNLRAACPGDTINVLGSNTNLAEAKLSCYGITLFGLGGTSYAAPFRQIRCNRIPEAEVQATNVTCVNGTISRVGFAVSSTSFVPTIEEICVNSTTQTQWTHHKVVAGLTKSRKLPLIGGVGGDDSDNGWFGSDIWGGWFKKSTTTTTTQSPTVGNDLIAAMMVPREDMFFRAQQDSVTTALVNSLPMFKSVRNGNWRLIEDVIRKIASTKRQCATLDVWTGRYDGNRATSATRFWRQARQAQNTTTTPSPTTTTTETPTTVSTTPSTTAATTLSTTAATTPSTTAATTPSTTAATTPSTTAATTSSTTAATTSSTTAATTSSTTAAPATNTTPRFVFKMVVDRTRNRGLAFVTLSDPTATAITAAQQLCTPYARCSELYPQFNVVTRGYTHCCTLNDFASIAAEIGLPTFPNAQPLF